MTQPRLQRVLHQHLQTDRLLGVASVPVGDHIGINTLPPSGSEPASHAPNESPAADAGHPPPAVQTSAPAPPLDQAAKADLLALMDREEVSVCTKCALCDSRTQTVFGQGAPDARLMLIGEGPGHHEDQQGQPFVGPAGQLLNKQIAAMGLEREQVYIANVVKCRPPNNRAPSTTEADACWEYLLRQIQIIQPEVILTLGGPAAKRLLNTTQGVTAIRGTWHHFDALVAQGGPSIPVMPTFHPAYLLRAYTPDNRKKVWSDLQQVMAKLGGPTG